MAPSSTPPPAAPNRDFRGWMLYAATLVSFLVLFHNYGLSIFPSVRLDIPPAKIHRYSEHPSYAYAFNFNASEPNRYDSPSSRVTFYEDGEPYPTNLTRTDEVSLVGGDRYSHQPGVIVFSSRNNSDPRTNGRHYAVGYPILYSDGIGRVSIVGFAVCIVLLYRRRRSQSQPTRAPDPSALTWKVNLWGAAVLFAVGLYLNTGTLPPYAITTQPVVDQTTGYAYNPDHIHFRVLFDFVDGRDRSVWDHAILLRRVLFPVLGWPLMKIFGFEVGGAITGIALSVAALLASLCYLRRTIGAKGAILAGWLLALYPGAAYWEGLPYSYSLIFPFSLLLMIGLTELKESRGKRFVVISLAMGLAYLGYDFAVFFIPASILLLVARRRFAAAALTTLIQAAPTSLWLFIMARGLHQPLENPNTGVYHEVIGAYLNATGFGSFWPHLRTILSTGMGTFFGANFIFLPGLFLGVLAINAATCRVKMSLAEAALLVSALALFLFLNLAPDYTSTWVMRGTWISRLYQPVFAALIFFIARWGQQVPSEITAVRWATVGAVLVASAGNALIVFGPIANNPWSISEISFYRFYNHMDQHQTYRNNLARLGRRPIGFEREQPKPLDSAGIIAAARQQLDLARTQLQNTRRALAQNRLAYLATARALAANHFELIKVESALHPSSPAQPQPASADALLLPTARAIATDPSLTVVPPDTRPDPKRAPNLAQFKSEMAAVVLEIQKTSAALTETMTLLDHTQHDLTQAVTDLQKAQHEMEAKSQPATH